MWATENPIHRSLNLKGLFFPLITRHLGVGNPQIQNYQGPRLFSFSSLLFISHNMVTVELTYCWTSGSFLGRGKESQRVLTSLFHDFHWGRKDLLSSLPLITYYPEQGYQPVLKSNLWEVYDWFRQIRDIPWAWGRDLGSLRSRDTVCSFPEKVVEFY